MSIIHDATMLISVFSKVTHHSLFRLNKLTVGISTISLHYKRFNGKFRDF